ncbi:MAG: UDP-galactopyranose mutase [Clostridia bacterium]|nr:UDP-galactopyranose mutase [Clostridia bacterium]
MSEKDKSISILISCHKPSITLNNKYVKPIQVGCALTYQKLDNCLFDNKGKNISQKNKRYCELTAQYYAWKNIDSDYYGFFHYRRYLSFAYKKFFKLPFADVHADCIDNEMLQKFGLTEENIYNIVTQYDLILPPRSYCVNNYYHYKVSDGHHIRDLDYCIDVIKNDYPEVYPYAKKYLKSGMAYFCNMFIMTKELFNEYCTWLFHILERHEQAFECKYYNTREYRVSGFLAERLFGIYVTYLKATRKDLKIKTLQRIKIKNTDKATQKYDYLIVGAGLFGSVCAHELNKLGKKCLVIDKRDHIGGNIYCEKIADINVHKYGAHIFHTSNKAVWDYINNFAEFNNYVNSPLARYKDELYNLPFNMNSFSKMWNIKTPQEAKDIIDKQKADSFVENPTNLEEQALNLVGRDVYEKLIKGYTEKQWGRDCKDLPAFIIKRLPLRFTYNNNYFYDPYQGIPKGGYTPIIEKLLKGIEIRTNCDFKSLKEITFNKIIYTGPIDEFFNYKFGKLEYRTVKFETTTLDTDNFQGNAVVNYTEREIPYTRIIEHKHFEFGSQPKTVISKEYPIEWKDGMEPYYPINNDRNNELYQKYVEEAKNLKNVIFGGRLGTYKYLDMDKTIETALQLIDSLKNNN